MARSLLIVSLALQNPSFSPVPVNFLFAILSVFSVFSITVFLCASHKNRGFQRQKNNEESMSSERKLLSKMNSNLGSKAQLMVKMISWRKRQAEEEEDYNGSDEAVWRKTIIMGERCRPLDFSGKILYDSQGNLLPADST
ncbi:hypothetical protein QUC31_017473 [Theobroma cacao]|uniref:Uncharacterized protein LOC18601915 n=2 Tax=Theobroma cacao TaxID=3641 RepID=A0AB32V6W0_THECC|nr:PREDICTED: uncharacterized protein LOC18601915 [Theobroma cacao]EOY03997.1 Uncharacterized protein TCM_019235 [Theobroma cacao]WRX20848.1 hypothetical protein QQP08_013335 [Theobroma cacao]